MKIYNNNFQECPDTNNFFSDTYNQIAHFLKERIRDEKLYNEIITNGNSTAVQITDGNTYKVLDHNRKYLTRNFMGSAAALKINIATIVDDKAIHILPGVALRPNFNKHQLVHELFHALSSTQHNYFNEEGITYFKFGTYVGYFDKNLNGVKMENNPSSDGLNEGITELLTSKLTNEYIGNYPGYVVMAGLLMSCNDKLLNAYFSSDLKELESFYSDLEEKQNVITRDDLCNLNSKKMDDSQLLKIITGAIKYNEAYNNKIDITTYSNYLDRFYMLDSGSWIDLISESLGEYEEQNTSSPMTM
jgi:hypothetical protein